MFPKGGMSGMYKKAQEMQKKMADIQSEISSMEVEGSSGGDMVKVVVSGEKKILSLNLDPNLLNEDKEMIEDLILVAINQAIEKVDSISKEKMGSLTGGMNIPGLF
ncbi:MAG: YbaB/EbfC family nucleoid-associated protein [Candidatus Marinimicrobia bacterium]|nr:YbaB/EbfC family nucleoid-associated protein [Candidatus Neomarinimicrobiota bacterium]|tara:strand:- start:39079 stop:39396 length:318 start_codon:yes stop_codon:yes gene_type:complete